jgi:outer membrane protein OmpA-like peptidoglycan-associated protein
VIALLVGAFVARWWQSDRPWQTYVKQLRAQPGIVIAELGKRDGKFVISGLRDPLAIDPQFLLRQMGINPDDVISQWAPYEAMQPQFVIERLRSSLEPPPSVTLAVEADHTVAQGSAPSDWLDRARVAARALPAGASAFDLSGVHDTDEAGARLWNDYIAQLHVEPGVVITETGRRDGKFFVTGLRDPLAPNPAAILQRSGVDPGQVDAQWTPYQSLDPRLVLKRLRVSLDPPTTVTLALDGDRIVATGSASSPWLENARLSARLLPSGASTFDLSGVKDADEASRQRWDDYIDRLRAEPGIVVTEHDWHDGKFFVAGLRDPLAADPQSLLNAAEIDPARVVGRWAPYQALNPQFVLRRLQASLDLPPTIALAVDGDRIVAQGSASPRWLEHARLAARMLPVGGPALDLSGVSNLYEGAIGKLRHTIEARVIHFEAGGSSPAPGQDAALDQQAEDIKQAAFLSSAMGVTTRVTLIGHSDSAGQEPSNLSLSVARAEVVRALLKKRGVNPDLIAVRGAGPLEPLREETSDAARSANRRVSFSLGIDEP